MTKEKKISDHLEKTLHESVEAKTKFWREHGEKLLTVGALLVAALKRGNKILIFGNGGSATDSIHFSLELVNRFIRERPGLPCIALPADGALLTCIGNDYSFDQVFERQVRALGRPGDVAIGLTTSGNSTNVIRAFEAARSLGMETVALLGGRGGKVVEQGLAQHALTVSATSTTPRIQETHIWILHSLCEIIDHEMFPANR